MSVFNRVALAATMAFSALAMTLQSAPVLAETLSIDSPAQDTPAIAPAVVSTFSTPQPTDKVPVDPAQPIATVEPDDEVIYPSLAAAVAAQDDDAAVDEQLRCLAGAIYFESKGEPLAGQLAVAHVVLNRARSGRFPANACGVILQRGQFGFVRGGRIPSINEASRAFQTALAVARVAMADEWDSPAPSAMFFNTPDRRPGANLKRVAAIGNHIFYR